MNLSRAIEGFLLSFVYLLLFVSAIFGAQNFLNNYLPNVRGEASISGAAANLTLSNNQNMQAPQKEFQPPELAINAIAAISTESNLSGEDKILFQKDSEKKLPIASLTKLMTAVIVLDKYDLSKNITVSKLADSQDPLKQDVKLGDNMPVESFLEIMLVKSSNKSAYALSEIMGEPVFVGLMNKKAKEIGLESTLFSDPTGLSSQNVSTAGDLTKLAEYILKNYPKIAQISRTRELNVPNFGKITNTDELLGEVPEVVCGKTGFTTQAKGCLLLVTDNQKNNDYIINVILGADDRFLEMRKLIDWQNAVCSSNN